MKKFQIIVISCFFTFVFLNFPFRNLQLESDPNYFIYLEVRDYYENYVEEEGQLPQDLLFLPSRIRHSIGSHGYPIELDKESGRIMYRLEKSRPFGRATLFDYIFNNRMVLAISIGEVKTS